MKKKQFFTAVLIGFLGFAKAGPAQNSLVIGTSQEPPNIMDPWSTNNLGIATEINGFMTASLIYTDNDGNLHPDIATRVPTLANGDYKLNKNAAGKVVSNSVTYTIRPDAQWSDGKAITSGDFAFWLKVVKDQRVPVPTRLPWSDAKIQVVDTKKFTITYNPPYLFADVYSPSLAAEHILKKGYLAFDKATAQMDQTKDAIQINEAWKKYINRYTTSTQMPKVVSGPFKPMSWKPGGQFSMIRNAQYWRKPKGEVDQYIKSIHYRFVPDTNALKINVISGQVDALSPIGLTLDQAIDLEKRAKDKFVVKYFSAGTWEQISIPYIGKRAESLGLTDKRVRQALLYSIDRKAMTKALFAGKQPLTNTWINSASKLVKKDIKQYNYDPAKAKKMFAIAGWKPGPDGILQKNGKKMILTLTTTAGNKIRERVEQILKDQWKKVGVQVKIQNYPASVVFSNEFAKKGDEGKWDLFMFAWGSDAISEDGSLWVGKEAPTKANGFTGSNYAKYKSKAYDTLWEKANIEFDSANRIKLFDKMQMIWNEDLPVLPLYYRMSAYTRAPGLVNYDFTANSVFNSWNAYQIGWKSKGAVEDK